MNIHNINVQEQNLKNCHNVVLGIRNIMINFIEYERKKI